MLRQYGSLQLSHGGVVEYHSTSVIVYEGSVAGSTVPQETYGAPDDNSYSNIGKLEFFLGLKFWY